MPFTSYHFVLFCLILIPLYYTVFKRVQWQFLLFASIVFYAFSGLHNVLYILAVVISTYAATLYMEHCLAHQEKNIGGLSKEDAKKLRATTKKRRKNMMIACLLFNIGILAVTKYTAFAMNTLGSLFNARIFDTSLFVKIAVPLGLSFYTFKTVGYLIDAYRAKKTGFVERNIFKLALFTSFFPQILQGPISRFSDLEKSLYADHRADGTSISYGLLRVLFGFFKKLVIAERLLPLVMGLSTHHEQYKGVYVLFVMFLYAVALYCDFTGGIDITIGIAKTLGITMAENFNRPFYAKNVAEYWRRWHITMGAWFRDYIFYPLSLSKSILRLIKPCTNIFGKHLGKRIPVWITILVTWFATGIWHGASWNFIVWGLLNGLVLIVSQEFEGLYGQFHRKCSFANGKCYDMFQIMRTFFIMALIRTLDVYANVGLTFSMYGSIFTDFGSDFLSQGFTAFDITLADFGVCAVGVGVLIIIGVVKNRFPDCFNRYIGWNVNKAVDRVVSRAVDVAVGPMAFRLCASCLLLLAIIVFGKYGFGYDLSGFIYTQF